jgi:hypothetical protein
MFGAFKLFDAGLEAGDGFAEELCPRLALSVVILAEVLLLRTNALLTGRLCAVTALGTEYEY